MDDLDLEAGPPQNFPTAVAAVKRGAFDFVEKPFSNNALVDRVELALQASAQALLDRNARHVTSRLLAELTERERDVLRLVKLGRPNKLIADELGISARFCMFAGCLIIVTLES